METLFIYLIKSSGLIGMFYLSYHILLRKETFFNSNRWFLLAGLISSVVLPLVVFTKIVWVDPTPTNFDWSKIPVTNTVENEAFEINWYFVFAVVYSIGIVGFLLKFAFDFYSLAKVLKGKTIRKQADFKFIDITENVSPFSYFNSIVYNSSLYSETELENILEHEKVHSAQNHTIDVLISRLFCIVFWFNPLVWLYKNAISQNLEFIADSEASKIISDKKAYQLTLLKITTQENCVAITNHFYQSLIKKRIVMLNKNQSNKRNSWKYLLVLPLLGAFVFFFQVKVVAQEKATPKQENETNTEAVDLTTFKIEKDLTNLSKGKEIYINGEKSSQEELAKLDPKEIEKIDVAKINNKESILITPKVLIKAVKITEKEIYIDGVKSTNEEFSKLDQKSINNVDVDTFENTVRITTKTIHQSADNIDIPTPPTPPTPPAFTFKTPKPPVFPKAPKAPKGDPINGDKKAWKEYENKMEEFNKKMEALEPQMKAFDKQMEEFEKEMEPFNAEMEAFEKKMKVYELQMEKYEAKMKAEIGK